MKPVDQTQFGHKPGKPDAGNCFSACLASILELPLEAVPNFAALPKVDEWEPAIQAFLEPLGLWLLTVTATNGEGSTWTPCGYHVISGKSPRGEWLHSVVGLRGEIAHDPHPSRAGLDTIEEYSILAIRDALRGRRHRR